MKPDEVAFLKAVASRPRGVSVRDIMDGSDVPWKRECYLLKKWARKGWYDYGVNLELGWLTPAGHDAAARLS